MTLQRLFRVAIAAGAIVVSPLAFAGPGADPALAAIAAKLTGDSTRTWVLVALQVFLGPGDRCKKGEVYRFSSDKTLEIDRCENGRLKVVKDHWFLTRKGPIDVELHYGPNWGLVLFGADGRTMRLQQVTADKLHPTHNEDFSLSED